MKKFRTVIALLLVAALAIGALSACGGSGGGGGGGADAGSGGQEADAGGDNAGRELNYGISGDTGTLYPFAASGGFVYVCYAFYEPLWNYSADGERYNVLASDWEMVDDTHYQLTIRDDVTFANGNPLTASDVLFSMLLCKDDPRFYLNVKVIDFDRTEVTGDYTMDIYYTSYDSTQEVSFSQLHILDEESYDLEDLSMNPNGTGPYICTDYVVNSHVTCQARDDYWGGTPHIQTLNFKVISEPAQYVNELETGGIDIASNIPFDEIDYVESLGYNVRANPGKYSVTALYSFAGPLGNQDARYAVSYAINREDIAQRMYSGLSAPCTYATSNNMVDYEERYSDIADYYSLDHTTEERIALAQEYADRAGLTGQTLHIITNGDSSYNDAAAILQANLAEIGVNSDITPYDSATYFSTIMDENNFDIALFYLSTPSYQAADVVANYPDFVPLGWTGEVRDQFGEISKQAVHTYDDTERGELLYQALLVFEEVCPWYAICESVSPLAVSADLGGTESWGLNGYIYQDLYWQ